MVNFHSFMDQLGPFDLFVLDRLSFIPINVAAQLLLILDAVCQLGVLPISLLVIEALWYFLHPLGRFMPLRRVAHSERKGERFTHPLVVYYLGGGRRHRVVLVVVRGVRRQKSCTVRRGRH